MDLVSAEVQQRKKNKEYTFWFHLRAVQFARLWDPDYGC